MEEDKPQVPEGLGMFDFSFDLEPGLVVVNTTGLKQMLFRDGEFLEKIAIPSELARYFGVLLIGNSAIADSLDEPEEDEE
jgi:hypothetical protein